MSIHWAESSLRQTGNERDAAYADMLAAILAARGQDIPLPETPARPIETEETVAADVGRLTVSPILVLREPAIDIVAKPASELTIEQSNLGSLRENLRTLTDPYAQLFTSRVPPSLTKSKGSRLGQSRKDSEMSMKEWAYTETSDDMQLTYKFGLAYMQGKDGNRLQQARMALKSQHDQKTAWSDEPEAKISFDLDNGTIANIGVAWHQANPRTLLKKAQGTLLEKLLQDTFVFDNNDQDSGFVRISMGRADTPPTLRMSQQFGKYVYARIHDIKSQSDFIYHPSRDTFTRHLADPDFYQREGLATVQELSSRDFIQVVADVLHLIPAVEEHTIYRT